MKKNLSKQYALLIIATLIPLLLGYKASKYPEIVWYAPTFHYYYIILSCLASLIVGYFAFREYYRTGDTRVYLLSIGFIGITIFYGIHGLITPGKAIYDFSAHAEHINAFVFFGDISRLWIGMFLFLLVMINRRIDVQFNKVGFLIVVSIMLVVFSIIAIQYPDLFPRIKDASGDDTHYAILVKVATLVLLGVACTRYYDSYRIVHNTPILTLMISSILIMETVVLFMVSRPWGLLWWLAHNLYLLSFISVGIGLFISSRGDDKFQFFNVHSQIEQYINQSNENQRELSETNEKLNELATKDHLTGLPNRNYINQYMNDILIERKQTKNELAVMFIDLDGFKEVNDTYGHDTGDKLLKAISDILKTCVREQDIVARLGGDEFLVILHNVQNKDSIEFVAKRIMESLTEPIVVDDESCHVGASIGISQYPQDGDQLGRLIRRADAAMYWVKEHGKNNYVFYSDMKRDLKK